MTPAAIRLAHDLVASVRPDRRLPPPEVNPLLQAALQVVRDEVVAAGPRSPQQPSHAARAASDLR